MRVATDVGGTFTDLVYLDEQDGSVGLAKASTTPPDFEQGVLHAIERAELDPSVHATFVHGCTVIINTLTQRTGARTALITTAGFRDVLELTRSNRPDIYNLRFEKPEPFVPRRLRLEVGERIDYKGQVLRPLDLDDVDRVAERLVADGVEAVAICFLHAYANPAHEQACAERLAAQAPGLLITKSHEITREWREYERTSTAVLNAYVQKEAGRYLDRLGGELRRAGSWNQLYVMQSSGGVASFEQATRTPIGMVESGPVGGVIGAAALGEAIGLSNVITFDVGGTTAKSSLIEAGAVRTTTDYKIDKSAVHPGYPIKVPVVDIVEIGAGGGSIAWVDSGGGLGVGPRSAGAVPGPACYPNGGDEPTVTDANLLTGRLNPDYFLGGEIAVSVERAREAMGRLAARVGLSVEETSLGVLRLANASMANAIKLVSVRRGYDPTDFALMAFGGGGSLHAAEIARDLRIPQVVVPPAPGHFSAWGMLMTDLRADFVRTLVVPEAELEADRMAALWSELEAEALAQLHQEGFAEERVRFERTVDARYAGQEHTVRVPVGVSDVTEAGLAQLVVDFHERHERSYHFRLDVPIEVVGFHLAGFGVVEQPAIARLAAGDGSVAAARKGERRVALADHGEVTAEVYDRGLLGAGAELSGPAIVEEHAATTLVLPGERLRVDGFGCLIIEEEL